MGGVGGAADEVVDVALAPGELAVGGGGDPAARFEAFFYRLPLGSVVEVTGLVERTGSVFFADDEAFGAVEDVLGDSVLAVFELDEAVPGVCRWRCTTGSGRRAAGWSSCFRRGCTPG